MSRTRHHAAPFVALAAGIALLAGCADDGGAEDAEPAAATAETEEAAEGQADGRAEAAANEGLAETAENVVEVGMADFAFVGLPDVVPAGTRLTVDNVAEAELHEVVAFRLPEDDERSVEELTQLAPGDLVAALGQPTTVLLQAPRGEQIPAVGDGTLAEPGRYAIMCFIPTGADPQEYLEAAAASEGGPPQVDGGPPHFVHGMFAELIVE